MKEILIAMLLLAGLSSCEDVERNDLALQANINNKFYSSNDARAKKNEDGSVTIHGFTNEETMTLHISRAAKRTFDLGENSSNYAMFLDKGGNLYSTNPAGHGQIVVSTLDEENNHISGTFKYEAYLSGIDTIYVEKGVFFQVPFSEDGVLDPNNAGSFRAKVNGALFSPILVVAKDSGNSIVLTGSTTNATITLSVPVSVEAGDYILPKSGFTAKYKNDNTSQNANSGEIKVLEHNISTKSLKGSFTFSTNQNEISEGSFEVIYE